MTLTSVQLQLVMPRADAAAWTDVLNESMDRFEIRTAQRMAAFLAQIAHESGELRTLVEDLNYRAVTLTNVWPKHFATLDRALPYARQPQKLANFVYANRLGNGDEASGDGWRFRGRGILQTTGRSNYRSTGAALALPLEQEPERLEGARDAALSAALFWRSHGLNELADVSGDRVHDDEDFILITRRINGGTAGLSERRRYWAAAKQALGVT